MNPENTKTLENISPESGSINHAGANGPNNHPSVNDQQTYTIHQASKLLHIKTGSLRQYCNLGVIANVKRNHLGQRTFTKNQLNQLHNIANFYRCGLTTVEIKTYLRSTPAQQKQILGTKKQQLWQQLDDIRQNIDFIERQEDLLK